MGKNVTFIGKHDKIKSQYVKGNWISFSLESDIRK